MGTAEGNAGGTLMVMVTGDGEAEEKEQGNNFLHHYYSILPCLQPVKKKLNCELKIVFNFNSVNATTEDGI